MKLNRPSLSERYLEAIANTLIRQQRPLILLTGAGFSNEVMPTTSELEPLLSRLLADAGITLNKKETKNSKAVWQLIKKRESLFKQIFAAWCARINVAPQHRIVAQMFYHGQITHLISFNWDNLIEKAYFAIYKQQIPKVNREGIIPKGPCLWKLHGDVEDLAGKWVFPYEEGQIFKSLLISLERSLAEYCPRFALIVGYSESEAIVRNKLIRWLEENIETVLRIHPSLDEVRQKGLALSADDFFERLNNHLQYKT
ncbi:MAG: hypothetical protein GX039_04790 [Clostridia bacterium]|nr:hypothetical protein [Clostridia bacterium]